MHIRAALLSHRHLLRTLFGSWLKVELGAEVVAEFPSGESITQNPAALAEATFLLADASTAGVYEAIEAMTRASKSLRVLVVTGAVGDYVLHRSTAVGASGVVHESDTIETFSAAVAAVVSGGQFHSPGVMERKGEHAIMKRLTAKELEVLALACAGSTDDETGEKLGMSSATAETHRRNLCTKLGVGDWLELVVVGVRAGVVSPEAVKISTRRRRSSMRRKK